MRPKTRERAARAGQLGTLAGRLRELGILLALALLAGVTALRAPHFATAANAERILLDIALLLIVASGQTMVVLTRNVDLSAGSILGLSGILIGFYLKEHPGVPTVAILAAGALVGAALGMVNGALVAWGKVPSIIATLGTLTMYRGLVFLRAGNQQVNPQDLPAQLLALARPGPLGLPGIVLIALAVTLLAGLALNWTRSGRALYALGSHPEAARLRGIAAERLLFGAFALSGALSGLAGVLYAARFATVNPASAGTGFELQAVAATVIGGTSILGGRGGILGTVLGSLLLGTIANALALTGVSGFWQRAVEGLIILAAVALDGMLRNTAAGRVARG